MGSGGSSEISGVRVFKVSPTSPASEAGLEVFFDFIVEINGVAMDPRFQHIFAEKVSENENKPMKMVVYNSRIHDTRDVVITPRKWSGNGLLGATVRYDTCDASESQGIRVLEVFPNSPAAHAGLVPFQDFLLGTQQAAFRDIEELVEAVNASINKRLQVHVYNTDSETVREIVMVPNNDWGGEGCIGCDIGSGLLHRIPAPRRKPNGTTPSPMATPAPAVPASLPAINASGTWSPPAAAVPASGPGPPVSLPPAPGVPAGAPPAFPPAMPPPAVPAVHGAPVVPGVPGIPPVPSAAAVPGMPVMPGVPTMPTAPGVPVPAPTVPVVPTMAGTAVAPGMPPVPGVPAVPGVPTVPGVPAMPAMPAVPAVPAVPAMLPAASAVPPAAATNGYAAAAPPSPEAGSLYPPPVASVSQLGVPQLPQPGTPQHEVSPASLGGVTSPATPSGCEIPRAPPSTPMDKSDVPPPVDLSSAMAQAQAYAQATGN